MASNRIEIPCDMNQGFNFRKDVMTQIGMINKLKIGDVDLWLISSKRPRKQQTDRRSLVFCSSDQAFTATDTVNVTIQVTESAKNKLDTLTKTMSY